MIKGADVAARASRVIVQSQRGQALALGLALLSLGGLVVVLGFNAAQTAAARARLTHVADAAAYSGALVQARALNLLATINRAQIAHQVAMAHLVTLGSLAQFADVQSRQVARGNPPAYVIARLFGIAHGKAYRSAASASGAVGAVKRGASLHRAFAEHDKTVHQVLERTTAAIVRSLPKAREAAMRAVVQANYPGMPVEVGAQVSRAQQTPVAPTIRLTVLDDNLPGYIGIARGAALRPAVETAVSHYGFLKPRRHIARGFWPVSPRCIFLRNELRRNGSTNLDPWGRWESDDTQSYHALKSNRYIGCYFREYAMGWGAVDDGDSQSATADGGEPAPHDFSRISFWRWSLKRFGMNIYGGHANMLAELYKRPARITWAQQGLPDHAVLNGDRPDAPMRFSIRLTQDAGLLRTTDAASPLHIVGRFRYQGLGGSDHVAVVSAAQTDYVLPPEVGARDRHPNLFRQFWQARLSPVGLVDRLRVRFS